MINIKCPYCNEKLYDLKLKNCPYCYKDISIQSYTFIKIQKEQKEHSIKELKEKIELNLTEKILHDLIKPNKTYKIKDIIKITITLIIITIIIPIILLLIENIENKLISSSIITLFTILLSIVSIIGVIMFFIPINRDD